MSLFLVIICLVFWSIIKLQSAKEVLLASSNLHGGSSLYELISVSFN